MAVFEEPGKLKLRSNNGTSVPEMPLALAITIINLPGCLSLTTCMKPEVAFAFAADSNLRTLS